ncbi:MAG TPA: DUF5996 family protein [Acidimicrobiales bacterium]
MDVWPELVVEEWVETRDTLHMWTQIVGKVRMELTPLVNHWWNVPLYVSTRGLTTSFIPYRGGGFEMTFDFVDHALHIDTDRADRRSVRLEPKSVATFYRETMAALEDLGIEVRILARPVEVESVIPFAEDETHGSYDPKAVERFWHLLMQSDRVLTAFRARFLGKVSPVHVFWGGLDLAVTRFSGRTAPTHPGGAPNCGDWVMEEAYSHEVSSAGYFPGGGTEGAFYCYAYPEPEGFPACPVLPAEATYDTNFREFLLSYEVVRTASDPDAVLLNFLQTTYTAAADLAHWDRASLERP